MKTKFYLILLLLSLTIGCGGGSDSKPTWQNPEPTRTFHMGMTPFPPGFSNDTGELTQIVDEVYNKLSINTDMVTHHFDNGIPWNDALANTFPYDNHIMSDWQLRLDKTPNGHKKYIAVTPINLSRNGLALLRDSVDDMALVAPFDSHAASGNFNHDDIRTAYLNYCRQVIEFFSPDYLAIGIETNLLRKNSNATTWQNYVDLNQYVYNELKTTYPNLPIFVSVSPMDAFQELVGPSNEFINDPAGYAAAQISAMNDVMASSDYYAIAVYPYMSGLFASPIPDNLLEQLFALQSKPIVIAETGMLAENVTAFDIPFTSDDTKQASYMTQLLEKSNEHELIFINWFVQQDYDDLCTFFGGCSDTELLWKDTGLYDGSGNSRPSLIEWQNYVARDVDQ